MPLAQSLDNIRIETGDELQAETDADVYLNVFGEHNMTDQIQSMSTNHLSNRFEKGRIDEYTYEFDDLGRIKSILIRHNGKNDAAGWFLDWIEIDISMRGEIYNFYHSSYSYLSGFNLYHTNHLVNGLYRDCLYYRDPYSKDVFQFIEYCIRFEIKETILYNENYHSRFTFEELRQINVTSHQLFTWSASIDLVENYQHYVENGSITLGKLLFYNCTYPWFGSHCEYRFDQPTFNFTEQVEINLDNKKEAIKGGAVELSCYTYLECDRVGDHGQSLDICLDWREVCDGKIDCINGGRDEEECWELEVNECDYSTEYRCHNGLCIPSIFLNDDKHNPDCLDQSDEYSLILFEVVIDWEGRRSCGSDPAFRCEEHMCRQSLRDIYPISHVNGMCQGLFALDVHGNLRGNILTSASFTRANVSRECYQAIICLTGLVKYIGKSDFNVNCTANLLLLYENDVKQYCPKIFKFLPIMFGHVQFAFKTNRTWNLTIYRDGALFNLPDYICYNAELCGHKILFDSLYPFVNIFDDNSTCVSLSEYQMPKIHPGLWASFTGILEKTFRNCLSYRQPPIMSNYSKLYKCFNSSKMISQHRLVDMVQDCFYGDDELYSESCSLSNSNHRFTCIKGNRTICLARVRVGDGNEDCTDSSDESSEGVQLDVSRKTNWFQIMCDGFKDFDHPLVIDGRNETDETECDHFPCNNVNTRCNGVWNCLNGIDEVNCERPPFCPLMQHLCLSPVTGNLTCLPIERVNDNNIDCLGATDERKFCLQPRESDTLHYYQCWNSTICIPSRDVCLKKCPVTDGISMSFCQYVHLNRDYSCIPKGLTNLVEKFICSLDYSYIRRLPYLALNFSSYYVISSVPNLEKTLIPKLAANIVNDKPSKKENIWSCNHGMPISRLTNENGNISLFCLCIPAYYGRFCEYQNQRVSLTVQLHVLFSWRTVFAVIVTLRDEHESLIESYDKFSYLPAHDCKKKFNIYLLYANRPKNKLKNYFVRIDVYNKHSFKFYDSWFFPIKFPFLPVHRMSVHLEINVTEIEKSPCTTLKCGNHGHCSQYINTNISYCRCDKGWSGLYCNISHECHCSPDSLCLDSNICLCRLGKLGPRCYLEHSTCYCQNGGSCIQNIDTKGNENEFQCICIEGFSGRKCEIIDSTIHISFGSGVKIPEAIHVHFIEVYEDLDPYSFPDFRFPVQPYIRTTTAKKIPLDQNTIKIYISRPFHVAFIEIEDEMKTYYLAILKLVYTPSTTIPISLTQSKRCLSINDLFNGTFVKWHQLRRMKYYHVPCKEHTNLACFYDEDQMCICDHDLHQSNCFIFDHNVTNFFNGITDCKNNGTYFQDKTICPSSSGCICDKCSYGPRCEYSTKGFDVSLDIILGYQIRPNVSFNEQNLMIKIVVAVVIFILLGGLINTILCLMTFQVKKIREVGSGYYLLISTYISFLLTMMFALKCSILITTQMGLITNRSFLRVDCKLMEFLLKSLINIISWLHACVGIERAILSKKETKSNQVKNLRTTKCIIICVCIITFTSYIHQPISRDLINNKEEKRTWCTLQFTPSLQLFNSFMLVLHFFLPFLLNIISAVIIIFNVTRHRATTQKQKSYIQQLQQQTYQLKHTLISPVILILLALPQLIISFLFDCMASPRDPWMYLFGNFISYIPSMLTFIIFVLPSKIYKDEFKATFVRIKGRIWKNRTTI